MHTVILGAGITGLAAAHSLRQFPDHTYRIYEQERQSGGYCRSRRAGGFTFDMVSHVLHFRTQETEDLLHELLDGQMLDCRRKAGIYFRRRYVPYPFQAHLSHLPFPERMTCLAGFLKAWLQRQRNGANPPQNFQEWIHFYLGGGIARYFMVPYNAKLWGRPLSELSVTWISPFVPRTSGREVIGNAFLRSDREIGYNSRFHYPAAGGMQTLVESFERRIAPVAVNHRAVSLDLNCQVVRFHNGQEARYDRLISTAPLKNLAKIAVGLPEALRREAEQLLSTSLLSLVFCVRHPLPHSYHWLYFPEPQFPFFRLVFPSNICPSLAPPNSSIIAVEISEPDLRRQEALEAASREQLLQLGLIRSLADIEHCERYSFEHAYPVDDLNRAGCVARLLEFFQSQGVWSVGRFGSWKYSSLDDSIVEATRAIREMFATEPARRLAARAGALG